MSTSNNLTLREFYLIEAHRNEIDRLASRVKKLERVKRLAQSAVDAGLLTIEHSHFQKLAAAIKKADEV